MVGTLKKWLGIDVLERENLTLAKALKSAHRRITELKDEIETLWASERGADSRIGSLEKHLTSEPAKPKIVAKPQRTSWKQFRSVAEKATDPEREEA